MSATGRHTPPPRQYGRIPWPVAFLAALAFLAAFLAGPGTVGPVPSGAPGPAVVHTMPAASGHVTTDQGAMQGAMHLAAARDAQHRAHERHEKHAERLAALQHALHLDHERHERHERHVDRVNLTP